MKKTYPIIMRKRESYISVHVPDFNISSQGKDYAEAMELARNAIGMLGVRILEGDGDLPKPREIDAVTKEFDSDIVTLVDIDFTEYRRKYDIRTVRRNVSLPAWLDAAATEAGINVSAVLKKALKERLGVSDPE